MKKQKQPEAIRDDIIKVTASENYNPLSCSIRQWVTKKQSLEFDAGKSITVNESTYKKLKKFNWINED